MKTTTVATFNLSKLTEDDLFRLAAECMMEQERRERGRKEKRIQWITSQIRRYKNCTANHEVVGETVVVAVLYFNHIKIAKATPVKGDVFDLDTGIAVAFAKAVGEHIPDYI